MLDRFESRGTQVFGLSIDSHFCQGVFAKQAGITYPMVGDPNREAARAQRVVLEQPVAGIRDVTDRAVFLVDRGGVVRYAWMGQVSGQPDAETVLKAVEGI